MVLNSSEKINPQKTILSCLEEIDAVKLAQEMLRIPSYSGQEKEMTEFLSERMKKVGLEVELREVEKDRYNVIGRLRGSGEGQSLILNGHIEHNMVGEGWTKDPFGAVIEDGWLYGFVHMKAANAAFLAAAEAIINSGIELKGDLVIEYVIGELEGGKGTRQTLEEGIRADFYIVGEPSDLAILTAYAGHVLIRINVLGRMKHFATALPSGDKAISAIEKMANLITALGPSQIPIKPGGWLKFEPRLGFELAPQINVGVIKGGISRQIQDWRPALLPDFCTMLLDLRTIPGMNFDTVERDLIGLMESISEKDPEFRYEVERKEDTSFPDEGTDEPRNSYVFGAVTRAHEFVEKERPQVNGKFPKVCDAIHFARAGIPGLIYGPGGMYTSRPDERCRVDEIRTAAKVYALTIADVCTRIRGEATPRV